MNDLIVAEKNHHKIRRLYVLYIKLLALAFILFAINNWTLVLGIKEHGLQFDTMPVHWRIASVFLCVIQPVVALGLWGGFAWGIVVWAIAALGELVMYLAYPQWFGDNQAIIILHLFSAILFLVFALLLKGEMRGVVEPE